MPFAKSYIFEIYCGNYQFKFASFCMQDQPILEIEILDHPWTRFNAMNPMVVSESQNKLPLEITFFEVNSFVSICMKL